MEKIQVTAKIDGGVHITYGPIVAGQMYTIDEEDFGAELFHRPPGFESPHERADRERCEAVDVETHCNASLSDPSPSDTSESHEEVN